MDKILELIRVRLGFNTVQSTKVFIYAHGYRGCNKFLAEIAMNDKDNSYQWYTGDMDAFGEILRDRLNNVHKEIADAYC